MKTRILAAIGLTAIISSCAPPEIRQNSFEYKEVPGVTRIDYFDGSYEINKEEPFIQFKHNEQGRYDSVAIKNPQIQISITDNKCDGVADMVSIRNSLGLDDVYYRYQAGKGWLFEKADRMLAEAKTELGL
ncbi:MAG: hypothetical protein WC852_02515 [Candidatus Nanoarchaeia archaeon]|jgi:hypothetical protein